MRTIFILLFAINLLLAQKVIVIDMTKQRGYAYEDGELIFSGRVSTGKRGHRTPAGVFRVIDKERYHISNRWPKPNGGAKMNYMLRLTNYGIAIHLGPTPPYPASHGCIRAQNGFAQKLFRWAPIGTKVIIKGDASLYERYLAKKRYKQNSKRKNYKKDYPYEYNEYRKAKVKIHIHLAY